MISTFKVGCNFDLKLLDKIVELNEKYKDKSLINEVYGSIRTDAFTAARPDFRLPDLLRSELEEYVARCNELNICFNYTLNTINPGSKRELTEWKKQYIQDLVLYLESIGIYRITVANPIIMEIVREVSKTIEFEISTIAHIDAVSQIKYLHEQYNIKKVCCGIHKNRTVNWLKNSAKYCNEQGIILELLVNEFCSNGAKDYTTHCTYRDSCYIFHSTDITKDDALSMNGYPMQHCAAGRNMTPYNWLRTRFVLPQDLTLYNDIGITQFKVSGRTGSTDYLVKVLEAYASQDFNGNLLELWKPLETIYSEENETTFNHAANIDTSLLTNFVRNRWFKTPDFDCANVECGVQCKYCQRFYDKKMSSKYTKSDILIQMANPLYDDYFDGTQKDMVDL